MSERVVAALDRAKHDYVYREWLLQATPQELTRQGLKLGQQAVLLSNLLLTIPFSPENLPDWDVHYGHAFPWMDLRTQVIPWTPFEIPLQQAKIALITTAGIYRCDEKPFDTQDEEYGDPSYRLIPVETSSQALCVKHHLALVQPGTNGDTNHLLPLRAVRQLRDEGIIGELASGHYNFMGYIPSTSPLLEQTAPEVAMLLRAEQVDAVILTPA